MKNEKWKSFASLAKIKAEIAAYKSENYKKIYFNTLIAIERSYYRVVVIFSQQGKEKVDIHKEKGVQIIMVASKICDTKNGPDFDYGVQTINLAINN